MGVEEPKQAGLTLAPSERVAVPRILQAPVSMECTLMQEIRPGGFSLVLGQILLVHVHDEAVLDPARQFIRRGPARPYRPDGRRLVHENHRSI